MKKSILIITGPTAVGKTDLVLKLAEQIPSEIINTDVGQFYTALNIGTAKPTNWQSLNIPHHMFDIISEPKSLTVSEYRNKVLKLINEIWERGNLPIITGGSGFYIQSLFFPPQIKNKSKQEKEIENLDIEELWQQLYKIDPDRANKIDKKDIYRINRALEIWQKHGVKPSEFVPIFNPPDADIKLVILNRDREELYERINQRVIQMINEGWIEEVEKLKNNEWENFLKTKKILGYDDILNYLEGKIDKDILINTIQQKTRNYAKRQITFFKYMEKQINNTKFDSIKIEHCNLSTSSVNECLEKIIKSLKN